MRVWILLLVCGFAVASAARYNDDELDLDIDPDTTEGKSFIDKIKQGFHLALDRIKERLEKSKVLAAEFGDRLKDITKKVAAIGKDFGIQTLDKIREINRKIKDLARDVVKKITGGGGIAKRSVASEMRSIFLEIKKEIMTTAGLNEVRGHIRRMRTSHPVLLLVKNYVESSDNDHLHEILDELFQNLSLHKARYASTNLEMLFQKIGRHLKTQEGFDVLYDYMINLQSSHPIVSQLHMVLVMQEKDDVRDLLEELIEAFEH